MTILPQNISKRKKEQLYLKMKKTQLSIKKEIPTCANLSMGMSEDYEIAIKHGATYVRLGTEIFGNRPE